MGTTLWRVFAAAIVPVACVVIGWLLGIGNIYINEWKGRKRQREDLAGILYSELKIIKPLLVNMYYLGKSDMGGLKREEVTWVHMNLDEPENSKTFLTTKNILELSDADMAISFSHRRLVDPGRERFSKIPIPALETSISRIPLLDKETQSALFEILLKTGWINEHIAKLDFCFEKTFDSSTSAENHRILDQNMNTYTETIARISRETADLISRLLVKLSQ
ncbi:MAG: hypothetical protein HY801_09245 [Candidatus Lindowbacteria bacterium]|nr:hypothetical protein [Candidatus Lindowbacteria bacterium]